MILSRFIKLFIKEIFYNVLMSCYNNVTEVYNIIYKGGYDILLLWRFVILNVTEIYILYIYIMEVYYIRFFILYIKEVYYICLVCNNVF